METCEIVNRELATIFMNADYKNVLNSTLYIFIRVKNPFIISLSLKFIYICYYLVIVLIER